MDIVWVSASIECDVVVTIIQTVLTPLIYSIHIHRLLPCCWADIAFLISIIVVPAVHVVT